MSGPLHDSSVCPWLIEIAALIGFEEEQLKWMFITSRQDGSNSTFNAAFLQRSRQWQHLKVSPSQSVNFNEHPDLKEWKLISQSMHNFQRSLHMCVVWVERKKGELFIVDNKSTQQTILLQSCSASLIWPLEYCPSVDENVSNMTTPVLICRYSELGKLMPTTMSGCIFLQSMHKFDISYTSQTSICSTCFLYLYSEFREVVLTVCYWTTALESLIDYVALPKHTKAWSKSAHIVYKGWIICSLCS